MEQFRDTMEKQLLKKVENKEKNCEDLENWEFFMCDKILDFLRFYFILRKI